MNLCIHILPTWLELLSLTFCTGILVCRLWVLLPSTETGLSDDKDFSGRLRLLFTIGIVVMMASSAIGLMGRSMEMSGLPLNALPSVLPAVIFRTHFGHVWIVRLAALILWIILAKAGGRHCDSRWFISLMLAVGLVVSMTESATGHAADAGDFSIREMMDWLHLLGASTWGGGVFVLSLLILPKIARADGQATPIIGEVAGRFSRIAGFAVGIIMITAVYNEAVYAGSVEALLLAPYGRIIIAKSYLFLLILGFGAFNRYVSVPLLHEQAGSPAIRRGIPGKVAFRLFLLLLPSLKERHAAFRFKRIVRIEAILLMGVLFCAALLRHEVPAAHFSHNRHAEGSGGHAHGVVPGVTHDQEHSHIKASGRFGPEVDAEITFPSKGVYMIFSQVKHHDNVCLFDFMVKAQ
ncbi:MAG TPA: CopD family protein [Geobacteraceae bacterium]|nr:CopD family protein [Geobacteraceae bacterium]